MFLIDSFNRINQSQSINQSISPNTCYYLYHIQYIYFFITNQALVTLTTPFVSLKKYLHTIWSDLIFHYCLLGQKALKKIRQIHQNKFVSHICCCDFMFVKFSLIKWQKKMLELGCPDAKSSPGMHLSVSFRINIFFSRHSVSQSKCLSQLVLLKWSTCLDFFDLSAKWEVSFPRSKCFLATKTVKSDM